MVPHRSVFQQCGDAEPFVVDLRCKIRIFFARFLTLSVYLMSTSISWLFVQGFRFNSMSSAVTGQIAHVTLASCDTEHPFQQRSENNIQTGKTRNNKIFLL